MNNYHTIEFDSAAYVALEFAPESLCPYHHKGTDINAFEKRVNVGGVAIEVVKGNWNG